MDIPSTLTSTIKLSNNMDNGEESDDYFSSIITREKELRKINEELDLKLSTVVGSANQTTSTIIIANKKEASRSFGHSNDQKTCNFRDQVEDDEKVTLEWEVKDDELHHLMSIDDIMSSFSVNDKSSSSSTVEENKKRSNLRETPMEHGGEIDILLTEFDQTDDATSTNNTTRSTKSKDKGKRDRKKINSTTQHLQNVQIKALSTNLKQAIDSKSNLSKSNNELQAKLQMVQETNRKLQSQVSRLQTQVTKKIDESKYSQNRMDDLQNENANLKKEISSLRSTVKECEADSRTNEMRLKRSLESVEKFKSIVIDYKARREEDESSLGKMKKEYELRLKQLKKQKDDLLVGFKKQVQLINVLKRQKIHLEASRLLDFTEKEFMKVLDWQCSPESKTRKIKTYERSVG